MVVKVFVSKLSASMEIKKKQETVLRILTSKKIEHEEIDITDPAREDDKKWMWEHGKAKEGQNKPFPPQIFNDETYCGDYDAFDFAVEDNQLDDFLAGSLGSSDKAKVDINDNERAELETSNGE